MFARHLTAYYITKRGTYKEKGRMFGGEKLQKVIKKKKKKIKRDHVLAAKRFLY